MHIIKGKLLKLHAKMCSIETSLIIFIRTHILFTSLLQISLHCKKINSEMFCQNIYS